MNSKNKHTTPSRKKQAAASQHLKQIRNLIIVTGAFILLISVISLTISNTSAQNVAPARIGSALGEFTLSDVNGKTVQLSDYKGKPVLINAWATWCPPCRAEMPLLNQYYQAHTGQGFTLLAVNAGDSQSLAASFASQNNLAFPVLLDPNTQLLNGLGIDSFPTSILVGKDGIVKTIHFGMFTQATLDSEITPLLSQ